MKVMQLLHRLDVGGVERGVIDIARALTRRSIEVVVASTGGPLVKELEAIGVPHYEAEYTPSTPLASLVPWIARIVRDEQVSLIHGRGTMPAWIGFHAARETGARFITTCHGLYPRNEYSECVAQGERIIAVSEKVRSHLQNQFHVPPSRIRRIYRGVDTAEFLPRKRKLAPGAGAGRIINVGRLCKPKGQVEFLDALELLRRKVPSFEAWIVGGSESEVGYEAKIESKIRQLRLESHVTMFGTRRDIAQLLAESDIFVHTPRDPESFGRVLIEAGAVGIPVISTGTGGELEIIDHRVSGMLVPPDDTEGLARAMFELLTDKKLAASCAANLRTKVLKHFTVDQMINETVAVYAELFPGLAK